MKSELKKYRNCPKCGKPMREHDINGHFKGAEDRFLQEIELNRTNSKDEFKAWLLNEKRELNKKIHQMHLDCESEAITINQNGLVLLSVWYNYADIIDGELDALSGNKSIHYPDKYYAWYHKILIALGKENQFTPGAKKEIIALGKNRYGAKSGFYQKFIDFDIEKKNSFVSGLLPRERKKWKSIITEISNSDIDVIKYLEGFPN